jgi:hypothetical protein
MSIKRRFIILYKFSGWGVSPKKEGGKKGKFIQKEANIN